MIVIYYDEEGNVLGKAWSFSRCHEEKAELPKEHKPHTHNPLYAMYGPYFCPGWPEVEIYDQKPRVALNPQPKEKNE